MRGFYLVIGFMGLLALIAEVVTLINIGIDYMLILLIALTIGGTGWMFYNYYETNKIK